MVVILRTIFFSHRLRIDLFRLPVQAAHGSLNLKRHVTILNFDLLNSVQYAVLQTAHLEDNKTLLEPVGGFYTDVYLKITR